MPYSKTCPYCGEPLRLNEAEKTAHCDACEAELPPEELLVQREEAVLGLLQERPQKQADRDGFLCENCGAQVIADEADVSSFCCFCGAPAMAPMMLPDTIDPEAVLPFAIDRVQAQDRFAHWFSRKKLIDPGFLHAVRSGRVSGIYVPFWLFDCEIETHLHAVSTATSTLRTDRSEVMTAKDYFHYRAVTADYRSVPVLASEKVNGHLADLLGPFDLTMLVPFDPALMAGFVAERNSLTAQQAFRQVREQLEADSLRAAREAILTDAYAQVKTVRHLYKTLRAQYVLMPVWTVNYSRNGFTHQFFMNGQTGKIVGEVPLSLSRTLQWFAGVAAGVAAAGELVWVVVNKLR